MLQADPIQSYLSLKIGLPPVLNSGVFRFIYFSHKALMKFFFHKDEMNKVYTEGDPNLSVSVA